jgi:hypothetical protein
MTSLGGGLKAFLSNLFKKTPGPSTLTNIESIPVSETKKRKRERFAIFSLGFFFCILTYVEIHLSNLSQKLPFVNSIF